MRACGAAFGALVLPVVLWAQGFQWELSPRLPVPAPVLFIGAGAHGAWVSHLSALEAIEDGLNCATYRSGDGTHAVAGAYAEWWYAPESALRLALLAGASQAVLRAPAEPLPLADGRQLRTEYQLQMRLLVARAEALGKLRLRDKLWVALGAWVGLQWRLQEEQWERVLEPEDYVFQTTPPARERRLSRAQSVGVRPYGVGVLLRLGLDAPLARLTPVYAAPALSVGISLLSLARSAAWSRWELGVELPVLWGIGSGH